MGKMHLPSQSHHPPRAYGIGLQLPDRASFNNAALENNSIGDRNDEDQQVQNPAHSLHAHVPLWKPLQEFFERLIEPPGIIHEECMAIPLETLQPQIVAELRLQVIGAWL